MSAPAAYEVIAFNTAAASDNKIHEDSVARRFGFRGALVPGVEVYAYMAHLPVARWGRAWLESGQIDCRFLKPVYDGAVARVTATEENEDLALCVESAARLGGRSCRRIDGLHPASTRCRQARRPPRAPRRVRRRWRPGALSALRL